MTHDYTERVVQLLVVDDDQISRRGIRRSMQKARISNPIHEARHGLEALDLLRGTNGRTAIPRPFTVLLDLKMPQMNGFEFLEAVRADPELTTANIFVLTTSKDDEDRARAYRHHVAGYVVKADAATSLMQAVEMLNCYWRTILMP